MSEGTFTTGKSAAREAKTSKELAKKSNDKGLKSFAGRGREIPRSARQENKLCGRRESNTMQSLVQHV